MKKVLEFAAKEITVGDSQASWQKWSAEQQQQAGNKNKADERQFTKKIQDAKWSRQVDPATGQPYWIDSVSGNVTHAEPNFVETIAEEEEEPEKPTTTVQYEAPQAAAAAAQPPQIWEVMLNSLTRKPMWYCEQVQVTLHKAPPPAPWRVVREENGQVYFWNPETGVTRD